MPITHTDGASYYSQAEIETMIKDRVRGKDTELAQHAAALKDAEKRLGEFEPLKAQAQTLTSALDAAKAEAAAHAGALARFRAAGSLGIADPEVIDALEFAHTRAMAGVEDAKRVPFDAYLGQIKADPTLAPTYLRPVLAGQVAPVPAPGAPAPAPGVPAPAPAPAPGGVPGPAPSVPAPGQPQRPAWAAATAGQQPVIPGARTDFATRVQGAKTLDDIAAIQRERTARR